MRLPEHERRGLDKMPDEPLDVHQLRHLVKASHVSQGLLYRPRRPTQLRRLSREMLGGLRRASREAVELVGRTTRRGRNSHESEPVA